MSEEKLTGEGAANTDSGEQINTPSTQNNNQTTATDGAHTHHHSHHHHSSSHSGSHHSGSSHGHHHHHHHRRHHSRRSSIISRFKKFFSKLNNQKRISVICALALAAILVFSVSLDVVQHIMYIQAEKEANENKVTNPSNVLKIELINPEGRLTTDTVDRYLQQNLLLEHNKNIMIGNFVESGKRYDIQNPVALKLSTIGSVNASYKIEFADNVGLKNARVDYFESANGIYEFEHLYANTKYYYRVTAYTTAGVFSERGEFTTADTPRILTVDGISNVRDIGNWETDSGKRIKQGLLYRGTELDGAIERDYHLTNEGLYDMLEVLGIKFDMDLRNPNETPMASDALGSRVEHKYYSMVMYDAIDTDEGRAAMYIAFKDLANPKNYPMYMHCTYGCDRTGTVCYLLEALLGVSKGDCRKDYGLSNMNLKMIMDLENVLATYGPELSLKEQVELYLYSCDINKDDINSIRKIFLGEENDS